MDLSSISTGQILNDGARTQQQSTTLAKDFDEFLTLLTTQLQNQDPLAPTDTNEFTNQLVQFSQVEQSINTNQKLDSLLELQLASAPTAALDFVGRKINYLSGELNFDGANPVDIQYALPEEAKLAKLNIVDSTGKVIFTQDVTRDAGTHSVEWQGRNNGGEVVEPGTYSIRLDAINVEDDPIPVDTVVSGIVDGVEIQGGNSFLLVGQRAVSFGSLINVRQADPAPAPTTTAASQNPADPPASEES